MPSRSPVTIDRARPLLGTVVAIRASGPATTVATAVESAFDAIADVERRMSFHDPRSDLSRINRLAHVDAQAVAPATFRVIHAALALAAATDGAFDPTVGARLVASGHLPSPDGSAPPVDADFRDVELQPGGRIRLSRRAWLDLGGIAKGYAVDRAVRILRAAGVGHGIVNAGGDLRVFGGVAETIQVRDPRDPARSRPLVELREGAVATSAGYFSRMPTEQGGATALVDPRDGSTLGGGESVSVCAPRAIWADALTKVVLVRGDGASGLLRRLHAQAMILGCDREPRLLP